VQAAVGAALDLLIARETAGGSDVSVALRSLIV
jgi:hypothetical protein